MKTSSDLLWRLIQSLNSPERLFFKRNFSAGRDSNRHLYLKLFDAVSAQKKYDEAAILKKFAPSLNKKNIAFQKHYLHQQVCDALIAYENRRGAGQEDLYQQVQMIRLYRRKGLLEEAHSIWDKAVRKARHSESFAILNLLKSEFEKMILFSNLHTSYDELHSVFRNNLITYTEYAEMITLRDVYTETLLLKRKAHYDIDEELKERIGYLMEKISGFTTPTRNRSFWYGHYYRMSLATLYYLQNRIPESLELLQQIRSDWIKDTRFLVTHGEYYIELLYMINFAGVLNGSFGYVKEVFQDPVNELIREPVLRANFEAIRFLALNKIYNKSAQYTEVGRLIGDMKKQYPQWEPVLNADLNRTICFSLGIGFFVMEQYDEALFYFKRGIQWFRDGARDEYRSLGHLLLLMTAYCQNNSRMFDSEYRSTYSYFYRRKKKNPFETAMVQCLQHTFYLDNHRQKTTEFRKTISVFEQHKENVVQQISVSIFNFPGWLESRIRRISYRRYVEQKVKEEKQVVSLT